MEQRNDRPKWYRSTRCSGGTCVEVAPAQNGNVLIRDSKDPEGPALSFTEDEWLAFVAGVKAGDFSFR
ncbi:hypothetical protein Aab01nite_69300 [Paractinoplanes abujensis]|uniref:DUF397 domain-containing protein n=1 Tax=Paractinoplanes abujensis TaxID=882441 RepID=A0A7W7G6A3_9ACTN|nr:DUF397 domain-containing protein [Actinoplanes abujensis]MBB4695756.1 hypothetical protein [Actinoplanes abujensis]GID23340.1 hypothetical protein Aab01nite_69300 [Actinoplanes abujensis]